MDHFCPKLFFSIEFFLFFPHITTSFKIIFVPDSTKTKKIELSESKNNDIQWRIQSKVQNSKSSTAPKLIPAYYNYEEISHTKPKLRKLFVKNDKEDITSQVKILTKQVNLLIEWWNT